MTAPTTLFGGNSDGAMAMEEWLTHMCQGCRRGVTRDGLAGMDCPLPAQAYMEPYDDIRAWQEVDPELIDPELQGVICSDWAARPKRPPRQVPGQLALTEAAS